MKCHRGEEEDEEHLGRRLVKALQLPPVNSSGQLPPVLISTDS